MMHSPGIPMDFSEQKIVTFALGNPLRLHACSFPPTRQGTTPFTRADCSTVLSLTHGLHEKVRETVLNRSGRSSYH
jgi:hypothetical protein